jgi:hypothetical protein
MINDTRKRFDIKLSSVRRCEVGDDRIAHRKTCDNGDLTLSTLEANSHSASHGV